MGCWLIFGLIFLHLISFWTRVHSFQEKSVNFQNDFSWVDLTEEELSSWYTPADLCVLQSENRKTFPQDIRAGNCSRYTRGSRRMFCGVGMGNNNYPCYGPYGSARKSFKRGVKGYTDASQKPILNAIKNFAKSKTTLILLGDSTMRQKLQSLECELRREEPRAKFQGNLYGILPCNTTLTVYFPDMAPYIIHAISLGPRSVDCLPAELKSPDIAEHTFENARYIVNYLNDVLQQNVVLVANMGIWYNDEGIFQEAITPVLNWLNSVVEKPNFKNSVVWHESTSQHWISASGSGYFEKQIVDKQENEWPDYSTMEIEKFENHYCCRPITNTSFMADWRNDIVKDSIGKNPNYLQNIPILPLAAITRPISDLHTCNPSYKHDCTHYCFTPLMWQPFWHQIYNLSSLNVPN